MAGVLWLAITLIVPVTLTAQPPAEVALEIIAEGGRDSTRFTLEQLRRFPVDSVTVTGESGPRWYYGVRLNDLLRRADVPTGRQVRGQAMSLVLLLTATDAYRVALSLSELDPDFSDQMAVVAYQLAGGAALAPEEGPLRLVIAGERRGARMIRQLRTIRVVRVG